MFWFWSVHSCRAFGISDKTAAGVRRLNPKLRVKPRVYIGLHRVVEGYVGLSRGI